MNMILGCNWYAAVCRFDVRYRNLSTGRTLQDLYSAIREGPPVTLEVARIYFRIDRGMVGAGAWEGEIRNYAKFLKRTGLQHGTKRGGSERANDHLKTGQIERPGVAASGNFGFYTVPTKRNWLVHMIWRSATDQLLLWALYDP